MRIGIFSLFHAKVLTLQAEEASGLALTAGGRVLVLARHQILTLSVGTDGMRVDSEPVGGGVLTAADATFTLTVPGKLRRMYKGSLSVSVRGGELIPVITLPTELAVASIVQAESAPEAGPEALKAQAVVSRSFLLASRPGHLLFDACDTTHCQYLAGPPADASPAAQATRATRGLVLVYRASASAAPTIVPAMYSRSCGGLTRIPAGRSPGDYPFYRVPCDFCMRHPERWTRTSGILAATENERLAYNRLHGWSAIPSNDFTANTGGLSGRGTGHGVGMCQIGAVDLGRRGRLYGEIVQHYFPNTSIVRLP